MSAQIDGFEIATKRSSEVLEQVRGGDCGGAFERLIEAVAGHHAANAAHVPAVKWGERPTELQRAQDRSWQTMQLASSAFRRSCLLPK